MKVCKIKPSHETCRHCIFVQQMYNVVESCNRCKDTKEYEIVQYGTNFWSDTYALVIIDGKLEKVPAYRLYDIREVQHSAE